MAKSTKNETEVKFILGTYLDAIINYVDWIEPDDWEIYAGISFYFSNGAKIPIQFLDKKRASILKIKAPYGLFLDEQKVTCSKIKGDDWYEIKLPDSFINLFSLNHISKGYLFSLFYDLQIKADLVEDTEDELLFCEFPYLTVATTLNAKTRELIYGSSLLKVKQPINKDGTSSGGYEEDGDRFITITAAKATYNTSKDLQPYYPKWKNPKSDDSKDRVFTFDNLSDEYLRNNFYSFDLQTDCVYLQLTVAYPESIISTEPIIQVQVLIKLYLDIDKYASGEKGMEAAIQYDTLLIKGLPELGRHFDQLKTKIISLKAEKKKFICKACIFYSTDGTSETPTYFTKKTPTPFSTGFYYLEQVIEPQYLYQRLIGRDFNDIEVQQIYWKYKDWLKELVRLKFTDSWVWFYNNTNLQMAASIDRELLFLKDLRNEIDTTPAGPLKRKLKENLKIIEDNKELFMVRRGHNYSDYKRVIGSDEDYVYLYDNKNRILTRLPMYSFWQMTTLGQLSWEIYIRTKHLIPIYKVLCVTLLIAITAGIIGPSLVTSIGFRAYIGEKIRGYTTEKLLELTGFYKKMIERLIVYSVNVLLSLLPKTGNIHFDRFRAFIQGFINGYTHDSVIALFSRMNSLAALEPKSYKAIKLLMKVEGIERTIEHKISMARPYIDDKASEKLLNNFTDAFGNMAKGVVCLINNLYFLEYEQVSEFLDIYTELMGRQPITKDEWKKLRFNHYIEVFKKYKEELQATQISVLEIYGDTKKYLNILKGAIVVAEGVIIFEAATGGLLVAILWYSLCKTKDFALFAGRQLGKYVIPGAVVGIGVGVIAEENFRKDVYEVVRDIGGFLKEGYTFIFGQTFSIDRMERMGTLVGQIWGGTTLNKEVFGKDKGWIQKWDTGNPGKVLAKSFLITELKIGWFLPTIKLALFNYVIMFEKVIEASVAEWKEIQDKFDEILTDTEFSDILEDDHKLTLGKILEIINELDERLTQWLKKLSEVPELTDKIAIVASLLEKSTPDKFPSFKDLMGDSDLGEWSREAITFVILSHLHASLMLLVDAIKTVNEPINANNDFSIVHLLNILGFNIDEAELLDILDKDFNIVFEDQP